MNQRRTVSLFLLVSALACLAWGLLGVPRDGGPQAPAPAASEEPSEIIKRGNAAYEAGRKAEALAA